MCDMLSLPALAFLRTGQEWGMVELGASPAQTEALGGGPDSGPWRCVAHNFDRV